MRCARAEASVKGAQQEAFGVEAALDAGWSGRVEVKLAGRFARRISHDETAAKRAGAVC